MNTPEPITELPSARLRPPPATRFSGSLHVFDLEQLSAQLTAEAHPGGHGHRQMTIFGSGSATMVPFVFEAGGTLADHHTNGLVTIQVLDGALSVRAEEQTHALGAGQLLVLHSGVTHSVTAREPSRMLLSIQLEKAANTGKEQL